MGIRYFRCVEEIRLRQHRAEHDVERGSAPFIALQKNGAVVLFRNAERDRQAEAVYYYPREIECKAKWDVTQTWNVAGTPIYKQKPEKITKQKPEAAKKLKNRNVERARQMGIEYLKDKGINVDSKK